MKFPCGPTLFVEYPDMREFPSTIERFHKKWREIPVDAKYSPYFRHKVGVNSTKIVKTSSRPSNMAAEHTQVWNTLSTP